MSGIRQRIQSLQAQLNAERVSFDAHWRDLASHFAPRRGRFNTTDRTRAGSKRNGSIINGTGLEAAKTLASGMMAGLTSPARPWFQLQAPEPALNEMDSVKRWLYHTQTRMRDVLSKSNLYTALPGLYTEIGIFGTGCVIQDEDDETVTRFTGLTIGSYWLGTNARGIVDTLIREFSMTPRQMAQRFGEDALSVETRQALKDPAKAERYLPVWHVIAPNMDHVPGQLHRTRKPIMSLYLEKGGQGDGVLSMGGYDSNPVMAPRWWANTDDVWGDSPGMQGLGDCRALQKLEDRKLRVIDKLSDPPMTAGAEMKNQGASLLPGEITYLTGAHGARGFEPAYVPPPQAIPAIAAEIREHERRINTAFFADLFLMLSQSDRRQITAREVEERHEEKLLMLGPVLDRLHDELLTPIIDRTFDIMWRRGMIPQPPEELQGADVRPEYISILAAAQRAVAVGGIERMTVYASTLAQLDAQALDKIDLDQAIDEYSAAIGAPPTMIRSDEAVAELRASRAEQQQAAQLAEQASAMQSMASAAKDASETQVGTGSVLDAILSPAGAA
jgi:hypothetical protein